MYIRDCSSDFSLDTRPVNPTHTHIGVQSTYNYRLFFVFAFSNLEVNHPFYPLLLNSARISTMSSIASTEDDWKRLDEELVKASGIDNAKGSRMETLATILRNFGVLDANLVRALVALGEATSHIAVHLTNYVDHTYAGSQNQSGDDQLHLDIECDEDVFNAARESGVFHTIASEETPQETVVDDEGVFSLGCDPLDGSSVIDANFSVGSIFGIWPGKGLVGRKGREQVAAAVSLYGPRTLLCIALPDQKKVFEVTLVKNRTNWEVSRSDIKIKPAGKIFAPGNLRATNDHAKYNELMQFWIKARYQLRYTGGMVPDGRCHALYQSLSAARLSHAENSRLISFSCIYSVSYFCQV